MVAKIIQHVESRADLSIGLKRAELNLKVLDTIKVYRQYSETGIKISDKEPLKQILKYAIKNY